VISGLRLQGDGANVADFIFKVNHSWSWVVLENLEIANAAYGAQIYGSHAEVVAPIISGVAGGTCLDLVTSNNSIVRGGTIMGCDVGIRVYDTMDALIGAVDADHYENDKNTITDNGIGIYLEKGERIKFGYNSNFGNDKISPSYEYAVVIEDGMNGGVEVPELIHYEEEGALYTVQCEKDEAGIVTKREMHFNNPPGTIQLYSADNQSKQAEEFMGSCTIGSDGICDCTILPDWVPLDDTECGVGADIEFQFTAIYTNDNSSELMDAKRLNGIDIIFAGGGGIVQTTPSSEATDETPVEETPTSGGATGEGGGAEMAAAAGVAGCGGGASLIPTDVMRTFAPSLGMWWIVFGVGLITGIRYRFARIRKHNRRN